MDPTLNALAHKLRAGMSESAPRPQDIMAEQDNNLRHRLGNLLVNIGQKLQASGLQAQSVCDANTDTCIEAVG